MECMQGLLKYRSTDLVVGEHLSSRDSRMQLQTTMKASFGGASRSPTPWLAADSDGTSGADFPFYSASDPGIHRANDTTQQDLSARHIFSEVCSLLLPGNASLFSAFVNSSMSAVHLSGKYALSCYIKSSRTILYSVPLSEHECPLGCAAESLITFLRPTAPYNHFHT
jgi:hypothetical protein